MGNDHRGQLSLLPIADAHRRALERLFTSEPVGRSYMLPVFASREEALRLVERVQKLSYAPERFVRGICLEGVLIGLINDTDIRDGTVELGYALLPEYWGRGYATRALAMAMETLFARGFDMVKTGAFEENIPSIRVMEKCGMKKTPCTEDVEYRGSVHRCVYYEKKKQS